VKQLLLAKNLDGGVGAAQPDPLANQPMRRRVERVLEDDVAVGMELGFFHVANAYGAVGSGRSVARSISSYRASGGSFVVP
jgi:hypothetical protein